ncbi:MAG: C-GCAxxG-C-C family protein [Sulfolobales archaeon]|nr:C-GCAxxG-C-C family protein [Sulfolobales archaeon]MCX8186199.1 C-GCAxxG-C-C family protein [Sulfolobales archaeon]MDW7970165.1 C-GCAxxG-C-C family protein [Sulfolobales archaeon]
MVGDLDKILNDVETLAKDLDLKYHGCSQMALKALQEVLGIEDGNAFKAASALAGGVARGGEVCGALLGALMAVSLVYGRDKLEPTYLSKNYLKAMEVGYKVFDGFKEHFGSVRCRDIHMRLFNRYYNLRDPGEAGEFFSSGAINKCADVVAVAARLAAKAIIESKDLY